MFRETAEDAAERPGGSAAGRQFADACFFGDACILAVDDERPNLVLLDAMLSRWGYANVVLTTKSGDVRSLCQELSPDLILLDLHMPSPDGFELLDELAPLIGGGPYEPVTPIIVISGDLTDDARERALRMGASDFIAKPFNAVETSLRVRNLLKMRRLYRDVTAHNRLLEQRLRGVNAAAARTAQSHARMTTMDREMPEMRGYEATGDSAAAKASTAIRRASR